jgi:hypothetical protein
MEEINYYTAIFSVPKYIDVGIIESPNKNLRLNASTPRWEETHLIYDKIRELNGQHDMPWKIMGDFKEILFLMKRKVVTLDRKDTCKHS